MLRGPKHSKNEVAAPEEEEGKVHPVFYLVNIRIKY
jgi:hypothetical protein